MKLKLQIIFWFLSLSLSLMIFPVFQAMAEPEINNDASSNYLDYGKGHRYVLVINHLVITTDYTVMVANNTNDAYNITFEAKSTSAEIHLDYDGSQFDLNNNKINQLQIILVNSTTTIFTYYIDLKYTNTFSALVEFVLPILVFSLQIFLGGIVVIYLARKF